MPLRAILTSRATYDTHNSANRTPGGKELILGGWIVFIRLLQVLFFRERLKVREVYWWLEIQNYLL